MQTTEERISLVNLKDGAAIELFDFELQKVLDNIMDPNTKAEAVREVTLKIKIKPDKERGFGPVEIHATSKMAPIAPVMTQVFFGQDRDGAIAHEYNPKQGDLFEERPPVELAAARKESE